MSYWRESIIEDAFSLAPRLREADKQEIAAAVGMDPLGGLLHSMSMSRPSLTMVMDGLPPLGMFGLVPEGDGFAAAVWMLASEDIAKNPMTFLRNGIKWVKDANRKHKVLYNYVDARNTLHIKWLRWMGFVFINKHFIGPENRPFYEFVRIEPCASQR